MKKKPAGNKYAHLSLPQRQLDFHALGPQTSEQIVKKTEQFLKEAHDDGLTKVLVITGKGINSKDGKAVIKPIVQKFLRSHDLVKSVSFAPINQGGEGAMLVVLH